MSSASPQFLLLFSLCVATTASAQRAGTRLAEGGAARIAAPTASRVNSDDEPLLLERMRMTAAAGETMVYRISLPPQLMRELARGSRGEYEVRSSGASRLLSSPRGFLTRDREDLALSFLLNRTTSAGISALGEVELKAGSVVARVPLDVEIARSVGFDLRPVLDEITLPTGEWSVIRVRARNLGNATELVSFSAVAPSGWRVEQPPKTSVAARQTTELAFRVWAPKEGGRGLRLLRLMARSSGASLAEAVVRVNVSETNSSDRNGELTVSSATAKLENLTPVSAVSARLRARISDSVEIDAQGASMYGAQGQGSLALMRDASMVVPPRFSITTPRAKITAGWVGDALTTTGGGSLQGLGATAKMQRGRWTVRGLGGVPIATQGMALARAGEGHLSSAAIAHKLGDGSVQVQAVDAVDIQRSESLRSFSGGVSEIRVLGGLVSFDVGARRASIVRDGTFDPDQPNALRGLAPMLGSTNMIAAGSYRLSTSSSQLEVRALHAPGPTQSFSRGGDEITAVASHQLNSALGLSASAWRQQDAQQLLGRMASTGAFLSPTASMFAGRVSISGEFRSLEYNSSSNGAFYRSADRGVGGSVDLRLGTYYAKARTLSLVNDRETTTELVESPITVHGTRSEQQATIGARGRRGVVELSANSFGLTFGNIRMTPQRSAIARVGDVAIARLGSRVVRLDGEAQYMELQAQRSAFSTRTSISAPLAGGLSAALSIERNPILFASAGGSPTMYSLRLDHRSLVSLPSIGTPSSRRRIFVDENANGRFDSGEEALSGVAVDCAGVRSTSNSSGVFTCAQGRTATLDVRSLPAGVLSQNTNLTAGDIKLRRATAVVVQLKATSADSVRLGSDELSKLLVGARDGNGDQWLGRFVPAQGFVFDALPVGRYTVQIAQGEAREPVELVSGAPEVWVRSDEQAARLSLEVRGRPTRVRAIGPRTGGQQPGSPRQPQSKEPQAKEPQGEGKLP